MVPIVANGPKPSAIQQALDGMMQVATEEEGDFIDSLGHFVKIPRVTFDGNSKPVMDISYAHVWWELRQGNILLGEDNKTLFLRDVDDTGLNRVLESFHSIPSVQAGFSIEAKKVVPGVDGLVRIMLKSQTDQRVRHGIKFSNVAFWRDRRNGQTDAPVVRLVPTQEVFTDPFEVSFDTPFDDGLCAQAEAFLRFVTADEHSMENLCRMFACPLLEPFKALSFLVFGQGGNGKGILTSALRGDAVTGPLTASVDAKSLLGGTSGSSVFEQQQQTISIIGKLWAIDSDADTVRLEQMTALKKLSTGDTLFSRKIGENTVAFEPRCTLVLMTNNSVIMPDTEALRRRQVSVRMKDGRKGEEFQPLLAFIREHGAAPFLMASCKLWADAGDSVWTDVEIGDASTLNDFELWLVDTIVAQGFAVNAENPNRVGNSEARNSIAKLGLISKQKKIRGKNTRVLVVGNEQRFSPFRAASEKAAKEADAEAAVAEAAEREAKTNVLRAFLASNSPASENRISEALAVSNADARSMLDELMIHNEIALTPRGYVLA